MLTDGYLKASEVNLFNGSSPLIRGIVEASPGSVVNKLQQTPHLVAFWGTAVGRDPNNPLIARDRFTLEGLGKLAQEVKGSITLLTADEHGRFNGVPEQEFQPYLNGVEQEAAAMGINTLRLSRLYQGLGIDHCTILETGKQLPDTTRHLYGRLQNGARNMAIRLGHHISGNEAKRHGKAYAALRYGEKQLIMDQLDNIFATPSALIVLGSPDYAGILGQGIYTYARGERGELTEVNPWG